MSRWIVAGVLLVFVGLLGWYGAVEPEGLGIVAELLAAFLGAAVAVWGAMWVADHRDSRAREDLRRILADGVQKVLDAANTVVERRVGPEPRLGDLSLRSDLHDIILPWQHVASFRPYRELGDFPAISSLADLDAACAHLVVLAEEVEPEAPRYSKDPMVQVMGWIHGRRIARSHETVLAGAERAARAGEEALRQLLK